jgi:hypothetical protein
MAYMKTPQDICTKYISLQQNQKNLVNKKRKECDREMSDLKTEYMNIDRDAVSVNEYTNIMREHDNEKESLEFMESFIKNQVSAICRILIDRGFIELVDENYQLTALGKMAGSIAEVHGPIMSEFILKNDYFVDFNERDLVGILSCFTDIKIADDEKKTVPPSQTLKDLMKLYKEYQELETTDDIRSGIHYDDALQFDMFEFSMKWTECTNEQECKEFIQNDVANKGISVGDFNKAMMKIATIAKELMKVAEDAGQIELLYKLSKIEGLVFKYVTTAQSLYL